MLFDANEVNDVRTELENEFGSVVANFEITQVPQGSAPESIRKGWLGVVLPVRQELLEERGGVQTYFDILSGTVKQNHEAVPVHGFDAVFALADLEKEAEVAFWLESGLAYGTFVFRAHEGNLQPLITKAE